MLHGQKIVQMILTEVGIAAHFEGHAIQSALINSMGGNLHAYHLHPIIRHHPQGLLQLNGVRGGQVALQHLLTDHVAGRANQATMKTCLLANGLHHVAGGSFPLGARNANQLQLLCRVPIESRRYPSQRCPAVAYLDLRHIQLRQEPFHHQCNAAVSHSLRRKLVSIKPSAGIAAKKPLLRLFSAIACHLSNGHIQVALGFHDIRHILNELSQRHWLLLFSSQ